MKNAALSSGAAAGCGVLEWLCLVVAQLIPANLSRAGYVDELLAQHEAGLKKLAAKDALIT